MRVVITGTSSGIGRATALKFLREGHEVMGIDIAPSTLQSERGYTHYIADVSKAEQLPAIDDVDILVNNAGTWDRLEDNIAVNLVGTMNATEAYAMHEGIRSVLNVASVSAHNGAEFPEYAASKGGILAYTKWTASFICKWGATCNSLSPGGITTESNHHILENPDLWSRVLNETLLNRWADVDKIAEWIYFFTVINKSCTAQDLIIDNGETAKFNFVW